MDPVTLAAYERRAREYAADWHAQPTPADLYDLFDRYFTPGLTADVGCGSGRDAGWLQARGYTVRGFDPCRELLEEARRRYPAVSFRQGSLPRLDGVESGEFQNVLSETVIMHLPRAEVGPAARRLFELLAPRGTLYVSWRVTVGDDVRDQEGRLYTAFPASLVREALADAEMLYDEAVTSASSGRAVHRLVVRRR